MLPFIYVLFPSIVTGAAGGRRRGVDRRALAARYRALLALPDEERTDEERARVRQIVTLRLLGRMLDNPALAPADIDRMTALM